MCIIIKTYTNQKLENQIRRSKVSLLILYLILAAFARDVLQGFKGYDVLLVVVEVLGLSLSAWGRKAWGLLGDEVFLLGVCVLAFVEPVVVFGFNRGYDFSNTELIHISIVVFKTLIYLIQTLLNRRFSIQGIIQQECPREFTRLLLAIPCGFLD
jgi:hypothetical protein